MIYSLPIFSWNIYLRFATKLLTLPIVVGVGYEFLRFAGKHPNTLTKILSYPGLLMQRITTKELADAFIDLQNQGVHNLNLVTPTHYADGVAKALRAVKTELKIPVVYNCGGYESVQTLRMLDGLVDVYMPDFKYVAEHLVFCGSVTTPRAASLLHPVRDLLSPPYFRACRLRPE